MERSVPAYCFACISGWRVLHLSEVASALFCTVAAHHESKGETSPINIMTTIPATLGLASSVNSGHTCLGDEMNHYTNEKCNEAYVTSPTASRRAKCWLNNEG